MARLRPTAILSPGPPPKETTWDRITGPKLFKVRSLHDFSSIVFPVFPPPMFLMTLSYSSSHPLRTVTNWQGIHSVPLVPLRVLAGALAMYLHFTWAEHDYQVREGIINCPRRRGVGWCSREWRALIPLPSAAWSFGTLFGTSPNPRLALLSQKMHILTLVLVIVGIVAGLITSFKLSNPRLRYIANVFGSVSGISLILFTALLSTFANGDDSEKTYLWTQELTFYLAVSFPCVVGLIIANMLTFSVKLSSAERVTIGVESCYQNTAIATSAAVSMFSNDSERAQGINVWVAYFILKCLFSEMLLYHHLFHQCLILWCRGNGDPINILCSCVEVGMDKGSSGWKILQNIDHVLWVFR